MADIFLENEMYMPMRGYEGTYQITSLGRVYSIRRHMFLAACRGSHGYLQVGAWKNGKQRTFLLHRLVGEHFLEKPSVDDGEELFIDHRDKLKTNNAVWNLRWCSSRQNRLNHDKQPNCTSEFIGVSWQEASRKYLAQFKQNGKNTYLGRFDCPEVAAKIRDVAIWFATPPADRSYLEMNFTDYPFLHEDEEEDNVSIASDDTENSDPSNTDPVAFGGYGDTDEDAVEVNHFDAETPPTPPSFHDRRLENSDKELELTERSS